MSEFHDPGSGSGASLDRRVAVLEQIAADTRDALRELREDMRGQGRRLENLAADVADIKTDLGGLKAALPFLATKAELAQTELRLTIRLSAIVAALFGAFFTALHYWPPHGG